MSDVTIPYRFLVRGGTESAVSTLNEVVRYREIEAEFDTGRFKFGDGTTAYASLLYAGPGYCDLAGLADGNVLVWDAASSSWKPGVAGGEAATVTYDPTISGLSATDVQAAIDELAASGGGGGGGGSSGTPPLASSFTVFGPCTLADKAGRMVITATQQSNSIQGGKLTLPSTPYTIDITLAHAGAGATSAGNRAGLCLSDGTQYLGFYVGVAGAQPVIQIDYWSAGNSFSATDLQLFNAVASIDGLRLRITNDGTTIRYWVSGNGLDYAEVYDLPSTWRFTPTQGGPAVYNYPTTAKDSKTSVTNWLVTNSVLGDAA